MSSRSSITVLIIDDSLSDARLTQLWLRNCESVGNTEVVRTGQEAISRLRCEGAFAQCVLPNLVLLDVNLPDMLGWELLEQMRRDPNMRPIPVIVLTGTVRETDVKRAQELGAARCIPKPFDADEFSVLAKEIESVIRETEV